MSQPYTTNPRWPTAKELVEYALHNIDGDETRTLENAPMSAKHHAATDIKNACFNYIYDDYAGCADKIHKDALGLLKIPAPVFTVKDNDGRGESYLIFPDKSLFFAARYNPEAWVSARSFALHYLIEVVYVNHKTPLNKMDCALFKYLGGSFAEFAKNYRVIDQTQLGKRRGLKP
jgi:hypothetical protein